MITLDHLLRKLDARPHGRAGDAGAKVSTICDDSRQVTPGCAFIARQGVGESGQHYIGHAIERGAAIILASRPPSTDEASGINWIEVPGLDTSRTALIASRFFDHPGDKLHIIGITGTNGKTTTAWLARQILERSGVRCGLMGTVANDLGDGPVAAALTTPGPIELHRMLAQMVERGCRAAACEFSSHGLSQGRVDHLAIDSAVFTNLTGDHLDYHGDMASYARAKARLFDGLSRQALAVVNADDPASETMLERCQARILRTSVRGDGRAQLRASEIRMRLDGFDARFIGPWGSRPIRAKLVGEHNVSNLLQALGAVGAIVDLTESLQAVIDELASAPGRLEPVTPPADAPGIDSARLPTVLVDYAHTDDALANVLTTLRGVKRKESRLWVVFGCGGDRDRTKRPRMAKVAWRLADQVVVTSDNPRTEPPEQIIEEILAGLPAQGDSGRLMVEPDRAVAIEQAVAGATAGDLVLIAGKGHECEQIIGRERIVFDDRIHAADALKRRINTVG
ncbi:MAG: UDP-N-acetylmuramoyl-L-alanyl-D-glutamate--2,6-diaminopimelate ligase [Phycisphaeraceae bacterium]|nr:UDP-N-acetylmuramoyl-L-alanyl-D-glutamate--2,6-diaminopimelate ligase [Phycisphaeraceae bacterium]